LNSFKGACLRWGAVEFPFQGNSVGLSKTVQHTSGKEFLVHKDIIIHFGLKTIAIRNINHNNMYNYMRPSSLFQTLALYY